MGSLGFWLTIALFAFVCALGITAVSFHVTNAAHALGDRVRRGLARDAETFGEPTREEVEAGWTVEYVDLDTLFDGYPAVLDVEVSDETRLFGNAAAYFDSVRFEDEVMATIEALPVRWSFR